VLCVCVLRRQLESFYHSMTRHVPQKKKKSYCCFSMNSTCNWTMTHQKYAQQIYTRPSPPTHSPTHKHAATHRNTPDRRHMRHTATHCNTLQHTASHCNTLQHTAAHHIGRVVQRGAAWCSVLQRVAVSCNSLQCVAAKRVLQRGAEWCRVLQRRSSIGEDVLKRY